jgi:hypothetical protein
MHNVAVQDKHLLDELSKLRVDERTKEKTGSKDNYHHLWFSQRACAFRYELR